MPNRFEDPWDPDPTPLEILIQRETFLDILHSLRPRERIIAALRLEGLSEAQIGRLLCVSRTTPNRVMVRAQERLLDQIPEAAGFLAGRRFEPGLRPAAKPLLEKG